jgi:hypothetical protein
MWNPLAPSLLNPSKPYTASQQQPLIDSSAPSVSSIKNEAAPLLNQEPFSENTSPSKPTNGTSPTQVSSKPIPSPIAENPSLALAYTIDCVDIATGWTEQRAVWGKGETDVLEQIKDIEKSLPFPLLGFDCDNGS